MLIIFALVGDVCMCIESYLPLEYFGTPPNLLLLLYILESSLSLGSTETHEIILILSSYVPPPHCLVIYLPGFCPSPWSGRYSSSGIPRVPPRPSVGQSSSADH